MYRAFALIQPTSPFTLDEVEKRLRRKFPDGNVTRNGVRIAVVNGDWEIDLALNTDPSVLIESANFAEKIPGQEDEDLIASCDRRIEVWSETPDPMMEHFNDFILLIEVLQSFEGVIAINPREPSLM